MSNKREEKLQQPIGKQSKVPFLSCSAIVPLVDSFPLHFELSATLSSLVVLLPTISSSPFRIFVSLLQFLFSSFPILLFVSSFLQNVVPLSFFLLLIHFLVSEEPLVVEGILFLSSISPIDLPSTIW